MKLAHILSLSVMLAVGSSAMAGPFPSNRDKSDWVDIPERPVPKKPADPRWPKNPSPPIMVPLNR